MARKANTSTGETAMVDEYPKVKQIVRSISLSGRTDMNLGFYNVQEVDQYVSEWIERGYKLFNTHYLERNEMAYMVLYVLVRDV